MKRTLSWIDRLSPVLFWDVERTSINAETHARWLLERVLERGQWEDWLLLRDNMGKEVIAAQAKHMRVDQKARNFLEHWLCLS